jgi:hypothetical protein
MQNKKLKLATEPLVVANFGVEAEGDVLNALWERGGCAEGSTVLGIGVKCYVQSVHGRERRTQHRRTHPSCGCGVCDGCTFDRRQGGDWVRGQRDATQIEGAKADHLVHTASASRNASGGKPARDTQLDSDSSRKLSYERDLEGAAATTHAPEITAD